MKEMPDVKGYTCMVSGMYPEHFRALRVPPWVQSLSMRFYSGRRPPRLCQKPNPLHTRPGQYQPARTTASQSLQSHDASAMGNFCSPDDQRGMVKLGPSRSLRSSDPISSWSYCYSSQTVALPVSPPYVLYTQATPYWPSPEKRNV